MLKNGHTKHQIMFKADHDKIRTAKVIYDTIMSIISSLRHGTKTPKIITYFDSGIDRMVNEAWEEQRAIGWDQILKGRLSSKWGKAQEIYYHQNAITRDSKLHSKKR